MDFHELQFKEKVDAAVLQIKKVLSDERNPSLASSVDHEYQDKYRLCEVVTNAACASLLQNLLLLGLTEKAVEQLDEWVEKKRSVTLRLEAQEKCVFDREVTRDVESKTKYVREYGTKLGGVSSTRTDKTVTKVTEYFWSFDVAWELLAYVGNSPVTKVVLQKREAKYTIKTSTKKEPRPKAASKGPFDVQITWLMQQHESLSGQMGFRIDRNAAHTPRRNEDIYEALRFFASLATWCRGVSTYFQNDLFNVQQDHGLDLSAVDAENVFVPVLPLFERQEGFDGVNLPRDDIRALLGEERRSLEENFASLAKVFPEEHLITPAEGNVCTVLLHLIDVAKYHSNSVDFIEEMLRTQLVSAIGKEVSTSDFVDYMRYHTRKIFIQEFAPKMFAHAVRRPVHAPEGEIQIQGNGDPMESLVASVEHAPTPMSFNISAATKIEFYGSRHLHGFVMHQFSGHTGLSLSLTARARQFSSFVLLVGRIQSAKSFEPKHAIIIKDKDDLRIPLILETIPTPKEFRDAIESLSPEQQRFCKAYRSMQLASTLFGVAIIQIKPQMEKLLKLPEDSLTKEIKLTQDLMTLFMEYQIPSDLLSFGGKADAPARTKIDEVKAHVEKVQQTIHGVKEKKLEDVKMELQQAVPLKPKKPLPSKPRPVKSGRPAKSIRRGLGRGAPRSRAVASSFAGGGGGGAGFLSMPMAAAPPPAPSRSAGSAPAPPPPKPSPSPSPTPAPPPEKAVVEPPAGTASTKFEGVATEDALAVDYTKLPGELDAKFEAFDTDGALRPTILNVGKSWTLKEQKALLGKPTERTLNIELQRTSKQAAFDLLDCISRSGDLSVQDAELHVVLAATHCFDKTLLDTVIMDNVNPIEKLERSNLLMASTIQQLKPSELIKPQHLEAVKAYSEALFIED